MNSILDDRGLVTAPLLAALQATGVPVGDGQIPLGHPQQGKPYAVLYSIDGGGYDGPPFAAPEADATLVYQVTSVGWRRDQCEAVAGKMRAVILGRSGAGYATSLVVTGWKVIGREADGGAGGPIQEGDTFDCADRYRLTVTPT